MNIKNNFLFIFLKKRISFFSSRRIYWNTQSNKNIDILILNKAGSEHIIPHVENIAKYYIFNDANTVYIKHLFKAFLLNFFSLSGNRSALVSYYISVINGVSPKVIITLIDNEPLYWEIDKSICKKIKFITIKNGTRFYGALENLDKDYQGWLSSRIPYYSLLLGFSEYDYDQLLKNNATVKDYHSIGNMLISDYISNYKKRRVAFDICVVLGGKKLPVIFWNYLVRYYKETGISICIALKDGSEEIENHAKILNAIAVHRISDSTQYLSDMSEVTLAGVGSTILKQVFSRGGKIYPINFIDAVFSPPFQILKYKPFPTYSDFNKDLTDLLSVDSNQYVVNNAKHMRYVDTFDVLDPPCKKFLSIIIPFLRA